MHIDKDPPPPGVSKPARAQGSKWYSRELGRSAGDPSASSASTAPGNPGPLPSSYTVSSGTHILGVTHAAEDEAGQAEPSPGASRKTRAEKGKAKAVEFTPDSDAPGSDDDTPGLIDPIEFPPLGGSPAPEASTPAKVGKPADAGTGGTQGNQDDQCDLDFPMEFEALMKEGYEPDAARQMLRAAAAEAAEREAAKQRRREERHAAREADEAARKHEKAERQRKEAEEVRERNLKAILSSAIKRRRSVLDSSKAQLKRAKKSLGKVGKAAARRLSRSPSRSSASGSEDTAGDEELEEDEDEGM
ncbi:uncharacterized protein BXZ73DRAFT_84901, partial [Epithele typhae]|uniref:uncharacterized protein n=1 Tax=Epithele typhae TaxID=378194 RepID=UPI002007EE3A